MRTLRDDIYSRPETSPTGWRAGVRDDRNAKTVRPASTLASVLLFASVTLLVLSKINHGVVRDMRLGISEVMAPAMNAAMTPIQPLRKTIRQASGYFELFKELQRLKEENRKLKGWEWRAKELRRQMRQLSALARVVEEPALDYVTARVVADASGPFVRIALINAGRTNGISNGYPAINGDGLVGRIVDTGPNAARLLLLSDLNSRVPVMVGPLGKRALALGDNSPVPKIGYLPHDAKVAEGDEVYTSGIGGIFPRGLRMGVLKADGKAWRVDLYAQFDDLEFVSVLFFKTPDLDKTSVVKRKTIKQLARRRGAPKNSVVKK